MAQEQMLCIVTADAPPAFAPDLARQLDSALRATGCVHFATLALLPAPPAPASAAAPSLMFEIVVDDGIDPRTAIEMMLDAGFLPLWSLYGHAWPGASDAGVPARKGWLREYLLAHTEPAACGFIGARDRSVAQILQEARLLKEARQILPELRNLAGNQPSGREELARLVLQWATNTHGALAVEPARRSLWRRGVLPDLARTLLQGVRLGLPALALVATLASLGWLVAWLGLRVARLPELLPFIALSGWTPGTGTNEFAIPALIALWLIPLVGIASLLRFAEALPTMLVFGFIAVVSMVFMVGLLFLQKAVQPVVCGVQLVAVGASAAAALATATGTLLALMSLPLLRAPPLFAWAAALGIALLLAVFTYAFAVVAQALLMALPCTSVAWPGGSGVSVGEGLGWLLAGCVLVGILLVLLPRALAGVRRALKRYFDSKDLPPYRPKAPLHQVHPSIDVCEVQLTGRQSHMISLTEVRSPVPWHGTWLRLSLWLVNQLADVFFADGRLGSADGIKFGHWRLVDGGRRLLFCSNYDGSFGGYLDEFIRGASQGANLIWRCTELRPRPPAAPGQPGVDHARPYPPTRGLILRGCKYEQAFKAYARASMVPHVYRFEAYNLSLQDIERATRLRDAICLPRHPGKMDQILRALES